MANGVRGQGNRARINTTSRGAVNPDCVTHADSDNRVHPSNGGDPAIRPGQAVQPAQIVRGQTGARGDNGDGTRSR